MNFDVLRRSIFFEDLKIRILCGAFTTSESAEASAGTWPFTDLIMSPMASPAFSAGDSLRRLTT